MNKRIKEARKALGLTQTEFGEKLGLTPSAILKLEKGTNAITERTLSAICREFNVSRLWLEEGIAPMFKQPDDDLATLAASIVVGESETAKTLLKIIATLSDDELALLERLMGRFVKEFPR